MRHGPHQRQEGVPQPRAARARAPDTQPLPAVVGVPAVDFAATAAGIRAHPAADAHMGRPLRLTYGVIRPCGGFGLTTTTALTQGRTLSGIVYRVPTCALIASDIKGYVASLFYRIIQAIYPTP